MTPFPKAPYLGWDLKTEADYLQNKLKMLHLPQLHSIHSKIQRCSVLQLFCRNGVCGKKHLADASTNVDNVSSVLILYRYYYIKLIVSSILSDSFRRINPYLSKQQQLDVLYLQPKSLEYI